MADRIDVDDLPADEQETDSCDYCSSSRCPGGEHCYTKVAEKARARAAAALMSSLQDGLPEYEEPTRIVVYRPKNPIEALFVIHQGMRRVLSA